MFCTQRRSKKGYQLRDYLVYVLLGFDMKFSSNQIKWRLFSSNFRSASATDMDEMSKIFRGVAPALHLVSRSQDPPGA